MQLSFHLFSCQQVQISNTKKDLKAFSIVEPRNSLESSFSNVHNSSILRIGSSKFLHHKVQDSLRIVELYPINLKLFCQGNQPRIGSFVKQTQEEYSHIILKSKQPFLKQTFPFRKNHYLFSENVDKNEAKRKYSLSQLLLIYLRRMALLKKQIPQQKLMVGHQKTVRSEIRYQFEKCSTVSQEGYMTA